MPSDTLLALMDLSVGQVFNANTFRQDVLKINNYYERIGYGGQVPTHVKDINLDPKTGAVTLVIQEGLVVKDIIIGGDPLLPAAAAPAVAYAQARNRVLRRSARRGLQGRSRSCTRTSTISRSATSRAASIRRRSTSRPERRTSSTTSTSRASRSSRLPAIRARRIR